MDHLKLRERLKKITTSAPYLKARHSLALRSKVIRRKLKGVLRTAKKWADAERKKPRKHAGPLSVAMMPIKKFWSRWFAQNAWWLMPYQFNEALPPPEMLTLPEPEAEEIRYAPPQIESPPAWEVPWWAVAIWVVLLVRLIFVARKLLTSDETPKPAPTVRFCPSPSKKAAEERPTTPDNVCVTPEALSPCMTPPDTRNWNPPVAALSKRELYAALHDADLPMTPVEQFKVLERFGGDGDDRVAPEEADKLFRELMETDRSEAGLGSPTSKVSTSRRHRQSYGGLATPPPSPFHMHDQVQILPRTVHTPRSGGSRSSTGTARRKADDEARLARIIEHLETSSTAPKKPRALFFSPTEHCS